MLLTFVAKSRQLVFKKMFRKRLGKDYQLTKMSKQFCR